MSPNDSGSLPRPYGIDEGQRRIASLLHVLEVSRQLAATSELLPLLELIKSKALDVLDCEAASVFLHDRETDELYSRVATGTLVIRFPTSRGIAGESFREASLINVADAYADSRFNPEIDRQTGFRTRNILTCPLRGWDQNTLGVIQVLNKRGRPFDEWDETLVQTLGAQAGIAVQRQLLLEEFAKKQRFERELDIARSIQQSLLPRKAPKVPGFDIAGWSRPADKTGGDVFDFKTLDGATLAVTVADATGHGIGPALIVAQFRALVRAALVHSGQPDEVVSVVNPLLSEDLPGELFVTAFFGLLHPKQDRLLYLSAGHGPVMTFRPVSGEFREIPSQGPMLNLDADYKYEPAQEFVFGPDDVFIVLTDGFHEWADGADRNFGVPRLEQSVRRNHALPAAELIQALYRDVLDFVDGTPQADDLTAVVIKKR